MHNRKASCPSVTSLKCLCSEMSLISEICSSGRAVIEDEEEEKPSLERKKQEGNKIFKVSYPWDYF